VVRIIRGTNDQITPYRLEGTIVGSKEELKKKTIGYKRYRVREGLFEGYMWQTKPPENL
jgi:hypothetical protein